jgi:hypothetical protein
MEIIMIIGSVIFITLILALSLKLRPILYTFLGIYTIGFFTFSLVFYESVKGYPTVDSIPLDNEPVVVYATHNDDYIFYWLLENNQSEPRAYKVPFTEEEKKTMHRVNQSIKKGKKIFVTKRKNGDEDSGRIFKEIDVSKMYKKE